MDFNDIARQVLSSPLAWIVISIFIVLVGFRLARMIGIIKTKVPLVPLPHVKGIDDVEAASLAWAILTISAVNLQNTYENLMEFRNAIHRVYFMHGRRQTCDIASSIKCLQELGYVALVGGKVTITKAFFEKFDEPDIIFPKRKK